MGNLETLRTFEPSETLEPMCGDFEGKSLLSIAQLTPEDIGTYIAEAEAAEKLLLHPDFRGANILPQHVLVAIMRQPSTRTGGSMRTAMAKLGGVTGVISGMASSSEAKGESLADSILALAIQGDVFATRTEEEYGPHYAHYVQDYYARLGKLRSPIPVINLGDGTNEHPTQTIGDLMTIKKHVLDPSGDDFSDLTITMIGNHKDYRAFHSLMLAAKILDMGVIAVQSKAAKVPRKYRRILGDNLEITSDIDGAMTKSDVVYVGRNPDEYQGKKKAAIRASAVLARDFTSWHIDQKRLDLMPADAILLHPRPRRDEIDQAIDSDPRVVDISQMENTIPVRMAVVARACGRSIVTKLDFFFAER